MKKEKSFMSIFVDRLNKREYTTSGEHDEIRNQSIGDLLIGFLNCDLDMQVPTILWWCTPRFIEQNNDKKRLKEISDDFKYVIDNVYNPEEREYLTPLDRYYALIKSKKLEKDISQYSYGLHINPDVDIDLKDIEFGLTPCPYFISSTDISNILYISLKEIMTMSNIYIKKCKNCGRYFIPVVRTDEIFCSHKNEDGKTCKEVGFWQVKKRNYHNDDVARLYRNTYQQKLLRVKRNPDNKKYIDDLESFREEYKKVKEDMTQGKMSKKEFEKWLLKVKEN